MKLIFFSDIHGNKYAFEAFLKQIENMRYDKVIFCGDVFGYYYFAEEIVQKMRARHFHCLLGNHDYMLLQAVAGKYDTEQIGNLIKRYGSVYGNIISKISDSTLEFLNKLKPYYEIKLDNANIGVFHGTPDNPLNGRLYPDTEILNQDIYKQYDYVILGHTHHKMVRRVVDTLIINPGSLGQQRDGKGCSYLLLDTVSGKYSFHVVEYNIRLLVEDIERYDDANERLIEVLWRNRS